MSINFLYYISIYLLFAFCGWLIEAIYKSFKRKKFYAPLSYLNLPFAEIYGIAGIILLETFKLLAGQNPVTVILISSVIMTLLEYLGGWWCQLVLGEKIWDYSQKKINFHGHTDLEHAFYWLILVALSYQIFFTRVHDFEHFFNNLNYLPHIEQRSIFMIFIGINLLLTLRQKKLRTSKKTKK